MKRISDLVVKRLLERARFRAGKKGLSIEEAKAAGLGIEEIKAAAKARLGIREVEAAARKEGVKPARLLDELIRKSAEDRDFSAFDRLLQLELRKGITGSRLSEVRSAAWAGLSPAERAKISEAMRAAWAGLSPADRARRSRIFSAVKLAALANLSPEERARRIKELSAASSAALANLSPEERARRIKRLHGAASAAWAGLSAEERAIRIEGLSAAGRAAWVKRWRRKVRKLSPKLRRIVRKVENELVEGADPEKVAANLVVERKIGVRRAIRVVYLASLLARSRLREEVKKP